MDTDLPITNIQTGDIHNQPTTGSSSMGYPTGEKGFLPSINSIEQSQKPEIQRPVEKPVLPETKKSEQIEPEQKNVSPVSQIAQKPKIVDQRQHITSLHDIANKTSDPDTVHGDTVEEKFIEEVEKKNDANK